MQDEKSNGNQTVILNLNPVNENISQFIQLQTGILSESEMFVPSDSILPVGTRVKIEYRLKTFGQKENVKIIDALAEVIGPEVDSEKGRRGVRVKFLKLSPTSQMLIQKLLEKIKSQRPQSGEKKVEEQKEVKGSGEIPSVKVSEPKVMTETQETMTPTPKVEVLEPKVQISIHDMPSTPALSEIMAKHEAEAKKEEPIPVKEEEKKVVVEEKPSTLAEIMQKEMEKPKSGEIQRDEKQAQYIFEYLPPGQPLEDNTGIVKIKEIVRSTDVSSIKKTSRVWVFISIFLFIIVAVMVFFYLFPQYAPKIFVRSHEVSRVITKQDLTPESVPVATPQRHEAEKTVPSEEKKVAEAPKEVQPEAKAEEKREEPQKVEPQKVAEEKVKESKGKEEEPQVLPLTGKKVKGEKQVKIVTRTEIKKEAEKEKRAEVEMEKKVKEEKAMAKAKEEAEKTKAKKEVASQEPGKVVIQVRPTDADLTIYIDGVQAGNMPTLTKQIPPGTHTIKVVADGYNEEVRKVQIGEGETKTIQIDLKGK